MMNFDIITIFPEQVKSFVKEGIFRIAKEKDLASVEVHDLRKWATDKHKTVDDTPYGGGAGMVMKIEPLKAAVEELRKENSIVVATTPRGKVLKQQTLEEIAKNDKSHYIILCGHYEGMDERVHETLVDLDVSIGDYVLSGGELPALVFVDGVIRLIKGVLGNEESPEDDSFSKGLLEYPQYTRPADFEGLKVPEVLLSGDHEKIKKWRQERSESLTREKRPDLVK